MQRKQKADRTGSWQILSSMEAFWKRKHMMKSNKSVIHHLASAFHRQPAGHVILQSAKVTPAFDICGLGNYPS